MPKFGYQMLGGGIGRPAATVTQTDANNDQNNRTTYTFTSQAIGTAAADRVVVACIGTYAGAVSNAITGCTIGGNTATQRVLHSNTAHAGTTNSAIYTYPLTAGTTATIVFTLSGSAAGSGSCITYAMYGLDSETVHDTDSGQLNIPSMSINVPEQGIIIAHAIINNGTSYSWTGVTGDFDGIMDNSTSTGKDYLAGSASDLSVETGRTVSVSYTDDGANNTAYCAASWR